jgi:lipoprotein-releasing system permease protein
LFPLLLARRLLTHQKGAFSAFIIRLAIGATGLSVAVMITAIAFIGGFKHTIREKLFSFWGEVLIAPYEPNSNDIVATLPVQWNTQLVSQVSGTEGVQHIYPFALRPGIIQSKEAMEGIRLKGITKGQILPASITVKGNGIGFDDTGYSQNIVLSTTTAKRLQLKIGDPVRLYLITTGSPRVRKLTVAGTYHTGMEELDKQFALCDIRLVQHLSDWKADEISGYQVEIKDNENPDTVATGIFNDYLAAPMDAQAITKIYAGVFSWLSTQDTNGRIILFIVGIVAIINLASAMLILMVDRAVMIGLLKTLGMAPGGLWSVFLCVAGLIAGFGILLGNVLGLGLCLLQQRYGFIHLAEETYNMATVPVRIIWWQIAILDISTLVLCVACTALPLLYIRRIQPARVLQFK